MRKGTLTILVTTIALFLITGSALGASLQRRLGLTGKAGAMVPLQDDFISSTSASRTGMTVGGGLIVGVSKDFAIEVDVARAPELDAEIGGSEAYEAALTDVALGVQYRLRSENRLVPFFGVGADFIRGTLKHHVSGAEYSLNWTEGGHVNAGVDYFVTNGIAFSAEARYVFAFDGDIKSGGVTIGQFDPTNFQATLGIRLVLPESAFW